VSFPPPINLRAIWISFSFPPSFFRTTYANQESNRLANLKLLKNQARAFPGWPRLTAGGGFRPRREIVIFKG
jgi:hypothetical protein